MTPLGCTGISNQLHFCKSAASEPEIGGNRPLQDPNGEHLDLRGFSEGDLHCPYLAFAVLQVAGGSAGCMLPVGKLQFCKSALPTGETAQRGDGAWSSSAGITSNKRASGWTLIFPVNPSASWWSGSSALSSVIHLSVNQPAHPHNLAQGPAILRGRAGPYASGPPCRVIGVYMSRVRLQKCKSGRFEPETGGKRASTGRFLLTVFVSSRSNVVVQAPCLKRTFLSSGRSPNACNRSV